MTPETERAVARLIGVLERLLDRRLLEEHDQMKIEMIHLRKDVTRTDERVDALEDATEKTGEIYTEDLKKKIKDHEQSDSHWVRYAVAVAVALFMTIGAGVIGYLAKR